MAGKEHSTKSLRHGFSIPGFTIPRSGLAQHYLARLDEAHRGPTISLIHDG
jgi:hypothetical protein